MDRSIILAAAALSALVPTTGAQAQATSPPAAAVETIPLDLAGPRPLATLTIGEAAPVRVIFDTGASGNVLDAEFATSLHLPNLGPARVGSPAGGTPIEGFQTRIATGTLGNARLADVRAVAFPFPVEGVEGVFGPGTFAGRLVHVYLGRGEVRITDKNPASLPAGEAHPYSEGPRGLPGVSVEIAGRRFDGHIDTGSNRGLSLPLALAAELPLEAPPQPAGQARVGGSGQELQVYSARIRGTVQVGPVALENPEVAFIEGLPRINVGMAVLRSLTIVLDPAERRGWLLR
jgi:hypothetical protein